MAEKRKAVSDAKPNKKARVSNGRPSDKDTTISTKKRKANDDRPSERRPVVKSVLSQEEKSFPRGGASVLTPLEQKQIRAQAEKDALLEQSTGEKVSGIETDDLDFFDDTENQSVRAKKSNKRAGVGKAAAKSDDAALRIQGLSFKNLTPGSLVLGRVSAITTKDIALALPNNLTGYVPMTAISSGLNKRIEALINEDEEKKDSDDGEGEDDDIELGKLFRFGQYLRAVVTEPELRAPSASGEQKRHIELSLDPGQVNKSLALDSVPTNAFIQAAVRSVEDHGVVMDLGLQDDSVRGFISKKELGLALNIDRLSVGQVLLCLVTGKGSNGKLLKLTPDTARFSAFGTVKQAPILSHLPDVDVLLPGVAVEILVTASSTGGVSGKVVGLIDVSADIVHANVAGMSADEISKKYSAASKVRARVIWSLPKDDGTRQIGVSLLNQVLALPPPSSELGANIADKARVSAASLEQALPISTTIDNATITNVVAERGVYMALPVGTEGKSVQAYAHISQLSDTRIDDLQANSGRFKIGSTHQVRVLNFNPLDGLYYVSLKPSILSQPLLRLEDIEIGSIVSGTVQQLILGGGTQGVTGILIKLSKSITALVPAVHMSDAPLQHPEKKFREGFEVKGRVLSVDLDKNQVRITLKKTLVGGTEDEIWKDYSKLNVGQEGKGTVIKLLDRGAVVQYYGNVRAFLPISEMSDAFVQSPAAHFRLGQTINTRILSVSPETNEMRVSCRTAGQFDEQTQQYWDKLVPGQVVSALVSAVLTDKAEVELEGGISGVIRVDHLLDGSSSKAESRLKKLRIGQRLNDVLVLSKHDRAQQIILTYKPSMVSDAQQKQSIASFDDVKMGKHVHGFVQNITPEGVYVEFVNRTVGLLSKHQLSPELLQQPAFGLRKDQSISVWIVHVDEARSRFSLSMRAPAEEGTKSKSDAPVQKLVNPTDSSLATTADLSLNKIIKVRVASVKNSQVNVHVADGVHGRIDVSEVFDSWDEIENSKNPLKNRYNPNQIIDVKVLGTRDAKGWRFLPITHRGRGNPIVELSAKRSRISSGSADLLGGMADVQKDMVYVGYINNIANDCVWVSLSPAVRGRLLIKDLSNDLGLLQNVQKNFPVGSALQVKVKNVSSDSDKLDLVALSDDAEQQISIDTLSTGDIMPGRITKIAEHGVTVQLSKDLAVFVPLVELNDDFEQADPTKFSKHDIVRAQLLDVNIPNKRIALSLRPSLVLSSSLPVKDPHLRTHSTITQGSIARGFVKHIGEKSVLVSLSGTVDAFVPVSDISDQYVKDWQNYLQPYQLVTGRVLKVDASAKSVQLSLKKSHVDKNYTPPMKFDQIKVGTIVTGTARKVEDFGVFIDIDNTQPRISGLAHRSEIAEKRVTDVRGLYSQGDRVKAKVLKVDAESRKISLGLKASYFKDENDDDNNMSVDGESESEVAIGGVNVDMNDSEDDDLELDDAPELEQDDSEQETDDDDIEVNGTNVKGLATSGFDWTGNGLDTSQDIVDESEPDLAPKAKRRSKPEIKVDMTGDLDKNGPQTTSDFERQLLGQPNDSGLWIQYMAFHLQLSEIEKAREIAERALRAIHIRETDEKANIWVALINLEVEYGDDDSVEITFKKACQVQDSLEMHEKLASIYIDSGRQDKADAIFERIIANKAFRASPDVWLNYATFLMTQQGQPDRARALLSRALQSVPHNEHRLLTAKFAALEFRTKSGDAERGRTIFEALVTEWPRWTAGWDMWVDIERSRLEKHAAADDVEKVRQLFERMSKAGMKKRRAKFVFKRWLDFEEQQGSEESQDNVKTLAREYVEQLQARAQDGDEE